MLHSNTSSLFSLERDTFYHHYSISRDKAKGGRVNPNSANQNNYGYCFPWWCVPRGRDACHAGDAGSSVAVASSSYRSDIGRIA